MERTIKELTLEELKREIVKMKKLASESNSLLSKLTRELKRRKKNASNST